MSSSPNILFIVADQHNAKALGHKGHSDARTPQLDRMAREGCRFGLLTVKSLFQVGDFQLLLETE